VRSSRKRRDRTPAEPLPYFDFRVGRFFGGLPCGWAMPSESALSMSATSRFFVGRGGWALLGAGFLFERSGMV